MDNNRLFDLKEICDLYSKRLLHIAYCITRDYHLAQDVVQEALLKAYRNRDRIQEQEKLGAWLSSITTRTAIDFVRKERRINERLDCYMDLENVDVHMNQNVEKEVEINLFNEQIHREINSLPPDQKNVLLLKIKHGLKEKEIAEMLRLNPSTVKTRLYRVRKHLKGMLLERELA
ncbi:RNA polymerase sigma factor [Bacillus sp. FJAT-29790]|uniref:RNA polymerase sigma factor n=1 Tax=Bacillus sp. FJAT-29790 TaxID=1895002 RepID=UPI001C228550|nr:RNA polymerase sigma factor [Bacillus sp. FJAT-29790]MBU8878057.1 RNA polymerase sigma factor [Bacillus sp. FJAT-29790]